MFKGPQGMLLAGNAAAAAAAAAAASATTAAVAVVCSMEPSLDQAKFEHMILILVELF